MATSLVAMAVGLVPMFAVGVVAVFLREDLGVSAGAIGLLPSALFAVGAAASPVAGRTADRWPLVAGFALLFLGALGAWASFARVQSLTGAVLALGAAGAALAMSVPVISRAIYEAFEGRARDWALGIAHTGSQSGAVLVGLLLPRLSLGRGWRAAFDALLVLPAAGLLLTVLVLCLAPRLMLGRGVAPPRRRRGVRPSRGLGPMIVLAAIANACATGVALYLPVFSVDAVGITVTHAGYLIVGFAVVSGVGKILWGRVNVASTATQRRAVRLLTLLGCLGVVGIAAGSVGGGSPLWAGTMVFGITVTSWTVLCTRIGARVVGLTGLGVASARIMAVGYLAGAVGPVLFGVLLDRFGPVAGWSAMVLGLLAAAVFVRPAASPDAPAVAAREDRGDR